MSLPALPSNCWYVIHRVSRSFGHGIRHPLRHPRHVVHHIRRVHHVAPPKHWVEIVCKAAHVAGAGTALIAPPAAVVGAAPYVAPYLAPPGIEQPQPYGGGGYPGGGGGFAGGGAPIYGGPEMPLPASDTAQAIPPGLLPTPEDVVLQPAFSPAPGPIGGQNVPPYVPPPAPVIVAHTPPHSVPEPSSALVLALGFLGAIAISVSKKASSQ